MRTAFPRLASIVALVAAACMPACSFGLGVSGNGEWASGPRPARNFSKVILRAPIDTRVREGGDFAVVVWIDTNLQGLVTTTVSGDTLVIDTTEPIDSDSRASIDITLPRLDAFAVEGSGEIDGSGDILAHLRGGEVSCEISGSGDIHWLGTARITSLEVSGSGSVGPL